MEPGPAVSIAGHLHAKQVRRTGAHVLDNATQGLEPGSHSLGSAQRPLQDRSRSGKPAWTALPRSRLPGPAISAAGRRRPQRTRRLLSLAVTGADVCTRPLVSL